MEEIKKEYTHQLVYYYDLDGTTSLNQTEITRTFEIIRDPNSDIIISKKFSTSKVTKKETFLLKKITKNEIEILRKSTTPGFILKNGNNLYYTDVPRKINLISSDMLGTHLCGYHCEHLSAASDELGGCEKIRNNSSYIERYDWITLGYETFNCEHDCFVVVNCSHYEKCKPRPERSAVEKNKSKLIVAQFVWNDITTLTEARDRIRENRNNGATFSTPVRPRKYSQNSTQNKNTTRKK